MSRDLTEVRQQALREHDYRKNRTKALKWEDATHARGTAGGYCGWKGAKMGGTLGNEVR